MFEKALHHTPLNKEAQFSAAYAYSNAGENGLAVLHYERTLAIKAKQEMATNNIGVSLKALKLPILAVEKYERSIELGWYIKAANLGEIFLEAGSYEASRRNSCRRAGENPAVNVLHVK